MCRVIRAYTTVAATLLLAVLSASCGVPGFGSGDDPTTPTADGGSPTATARPPEYPKTVTDLLGRDVVIPRRPTTVVALSQTALELVYTAGGEVVGRPTGSTYPPEAAAAAEVGDTYNPDLAMIEQIAPDLVIADSVIHSGQAIRGQLEALAIPVVFAGAQNFGQVLDALLVVGSALGTESEAQTEVDSLATHLADAQQVLGEHGTTAVILMADRSGALYASLDGSFAGDLLVRLGFVNPAGDAPPAGPFPGYAPITAGALVEMDPDVIFAISTRSVPLSQTISDDPELAALEEVATGSIVELDAGQALRSPGPRVVELIDVIVATVRQ